MARRWPCGLPLALALAAAVLVAAGAQETCSGAVPAPPRRGARVSVASFGGAGDGRTLNTAAFARAVASVDRLRAPGGAELYVPPGVWLTGPFNLTSRMTLFLARGAVIRATQVSRPAPPALLLSPYSLARPPAIALALPAQPGHGHIELASGRTSALVRERTRAPRRKIRENGTIDGQGTVWWDMWKKGTLPYTRPHLLELMSSSDVIVSNVVFQDSPFWNIHPVYCSNVVIRNVTILAPHDSPNTDGIDPDSSSNVCIEDCYISTGDDAVAIKSGWDEYGIAYGRPCSDITVRRITGSSPFAGFAVGSETSGGVQNVLAEHLNFFGSGFGIHIKTNTGRGGFIRNVTISDVTLDNVRYALRIAGDVGDHPDNRYNRSALPVVDGLTIKNVQGQKIREAGLIKGITDSAFSRICLSNVKLSGGSPVRPWKCNHFSVHCSSPSRNFVPGGHTRGLLLYMARLRRRRSRLPLAVVVTVLMLSAGLGGAGAQETCSGLVPAPPRRGVRVSVASFGGVGDGRALNTEAFARAVASIERRGAPGGEELHVPPGVWLTGPFNLTSHMTLFLARGAIIRATQNTSSWPLMEPLPSYGRGRELPGGRYISLIHGNGLRDVVITGENGTIDGQGSVWWDMWKKGTLPFTSPHLLELMSSSDIIVSNVVFQDSPLWNIHPVYCSNVVIRNVTVLAPHDSPYTDGIDPDSCSNVCIEDCYISTGDDAIAIKSGWDEYGIAYGRPSSNITVRRIMGTTPFAGFAIGSETSGGVENVLAEHLSFFSSGVGINIKTNAGRGGFIRNVTVADVTMDDVRYGVSIAGDIGGHPDDRYNRSALPVVDSLTIENVRGQNIGHAGLINGTANSAFSRIRLSNVSLTGGGSARIRPWECEAVTGSALDVQPPPCTALTTSTGQASVQIRSNAAGFNCYSGSQFALYIFFLFLT
ncbi:putative polygalacturonase [Dichanthelium oligosanthes]|uniref:Putative polygalacturonase n=1 Tax=Dichanthelium oligosanthes TaxID=888268 RepID=A0A1E5W557_9POAL|nr:putative polygalacturonase [Dichanthelium oligosanthes]